MKTYIKHLAHYHPDSKILNERFQDQLDTTSEWIIKKTGIVERRYMNDYHGNFPGLEISRRALKELLVKEEVDLSKVGMIISSSTHDDIHYPNAGNIVSEQLGLQVPVFQLKSACTSVAYAIYVARAILSTSDISNILVLNGEPFTRYVDYGDRSSCILFGDAATAMVISKDDGTFEITDAEVGGEGLQIVQATRVSDTSHLTAEDIVTGELTHGKPEFNRRKDTDKKFQQDGKKVIDFVINRMPSKIELLLKRNGLTIDEIDFAIAHQSNLVMMNDLWSKVGVAKEKHLYNVDLYGNTSSAGWISVLSQNSEKIPSGSLVLASVFGAGMTWSNILLKKKK